MTAIPDRNTPEYRWWLAGAEAEARARTEGMSKTGHQVFDLVEVMAQQGDSGDGITRMVALVYTVEWPLHRRLALAWGIIWGPYAMKIRTAMRRKK